MERYYEINKGTLALIPINDKLTRVIELDEEIIIETSAIKIIDESCRSFGSSLLGRHEGTKKIVGISYKAPLIICEASNIIFFPTNSPKSEKCIWISLNNIKGFSKVDKVDKTVLIEFINNKTIELKVSYYILENQILKASMLEAKVLKFRLN